MPPTDVCNLNTNDCEKEASLKLCIAGVPVVVPKTVASFVGIREQFSETDLLTYWITTRGAGTTNLTWTEPIVWN